MAQEREGGRGTATLSSHRPSRPLVPLPVWHRVDGRRRSPAYSSPWVRRVRPF